MSLMTVSTTIMIVYTLQRLHNFTHRLVIPSPVGGRATAGGGFSIPAILKPKRRGRGDVRAPLDEGNGGGIGGASLPLPPSTGGHPLAAHVAAALAGAVVARALSNEGDDPGLTDRVGPPGSEREATAESDKQ
jgi:hypothetical protein